MKKTRLLLATAGALLALSVGACSNGDSDAATIENNAAFDEVAPLSEPEPAPAALPTPEAEQTTDANASMDLPPEPITPPDEQMLDDASATGMTARATRDAEAVDNSQSGGEEEQR
ncbi:hypothetical protein ACFOKI_14950 [Sphingomonas qilianensis]|uniref:Secreted protein n=1 Tax=Sphingomonas qilianensis TaxID=1736690 RepID=A0ABU9XMD3_9SPHN